MIYIVRERLGPTWKDDRIRGFFLNIMDAFIFVEAIADKDLSHIEKRYLKPNEAVFIGEDYAIYCTE